MSNFKIGDRVKVIKPTRWSTNKKRYGRFYH